MEDDDGVQVRANVMLKSAPAMADGAPPPPQPEELSEMVVTFDPQMENAQGKVVSMEEASAPPVSVRTNLDETVFLCRNCGPIKTAMWSSALP